MSDITNDSAFLSVPEVAKLMDTTEDVVRKWARDGHFGAIKHGRSYMFPSEKLDMLSVDDVALWLGLNVQTVRRWARDKMYPTIKLGRRYYFSRRTLIQDLHKQEATA